jgi:hypothetical protein
MDSDTGAAPVYDLKKISSDPLIDDSNVKEDWVLKAVARPETADYLASDDPVQRRTHYNRLQRMIFGIDPESLSSFDASTVAIIAKLVHQGLNDVWSEIRKDTAKNLKSFLNTVPEQFCDALVSRLVNVDSADHWQHVHGSLLGLISLEEWIKSPSATKHLDKIRHLCVANLSHTVMLVRESAQQCFTSFFFSTADVAFLEQSISSMARTDLMNQSEEHCFSIQSCLGCLQSTLLSHTESFLCAILDGVDESPVEGARSPRGDTRMLQIIDQCMCHLSSIVRLSAGTLLSSLFKSAATSGRVQICSAVMDLIIVVVEDVTNSDWQAKEGYLVVCNEIINFIIEQMICVFAGTRDKLCSTMSDSVHKLLACLRRCLSSYIFTKSFELRRIATHIVPPFVRSIMFLSEFQSSTASSDSISDKRNVDLDLLIGKCENFSFSSDEEKIIAYRKDAIIFFVLFSEFVKHTKLILEAIEVIQIGFAVEGTGAVDAVSLGMLDDASAWAMAIPRRLGEEDFRTKLYERLISVGSESRETERKLKSFSSHLIRTIESHFLSASLQASNNFFGNITVGTVVSADIIETLFLTYGLFNCLDAPIDENLLKSFQEKLGEISRDIALIQLKLHLSPRSPMHTSFEKLRENLRGSDSDKLTLQFINLARSDGQYLSTQFALVGSVMDAAITTFEDIEKLDFGLKTTIGEGISRSHALMRIDSYGANEFAMGDGIMRADSKKLSASSKEAVIDRFMCESISPTFASIATNLNSSNCTFLIQLSYLWLDRLLSDPHWSSIKVASKKSILDFLGLALLRLEQSASTHSDATSPSDSSRGKLSIPLESITAISAQALRVLQLGLQRQENAICTTSIRTCRVLSELRRAERRSGAEDIVDEEEFSRITVSFKSMVLKYMSTERKIPRTPSATMDQSLDAGDIDVSFTSDHSVRFEDRSGANIEPAATDRSSIAGIGSSLVTSCGPEAEGGDQDEFSDWDDDEGEEDNDPFRVSSSSCKSPQKLSKMGSTVYLDSEMDLFMRYV